MKNMIMAVMATLAFMADAETIVYKLTMQLKVPRVYNNLQSMGFRKRQSQKIVAYVQVDKDDLREGEPSVEAYGCVNKTHKIGGKRVTYDDSQASEVTWRYIGKNKTEVFKNTQIGFKLWLDPSYNIGPDDPDNTLMVMLSGYGATEKRIKGMVTGQIGCGCHAYGHISPTRTVQCLVSDISPLCGTFTMKRIRMCRR